jgi:ribosome-binding ATPase
MKTGIIGLPQVGKTSLFKILTKAKIEEHGLESARGAHWRGARARRAAGQAVGALFAEEDDLRLGGVCDVAAIGQEALKETAFLTNLRNVDALIHVLRAFENEAVPHEGPIDPLRDAKSVEFDLMVSDLTQVEKRMERVEKDMKKGRTSELEREQRCCCGRRNRWRKEIPLRELEMTRKRKSSFAALCFCRKSRFCMRLT